MVKDAKKNEEEKNVINYESKRIVNQAIFKFIFNIHLNIAKAEKERGKAKKRIEAEREAEIAQIAEEKDRKRNELILMKGEDLRLIQRIKEKENDKECIICYESKKLVPKFKCSHKICEDCFEKQIISRTGQLKCSLCRQDLCLNKLTITQYARVQYNFDYRLRTSPYMRVKREFINIMNQLEEKFDRILIEYKKDQEAMVKIQQMYNQSRIKYEYYDSYTFYKDLDFNMHYLRKQLLDEDFYKWMFKRGPYSHGKIWNIITDDEWNTGNPLHGNSYLLHWIYNRMYNKYSLDPVLENLRILSREKKEELERLTSYSNNSLTLADVARVRYKNKR